MKTITLAITGLVAAGLSLSAAPAFADEDDVVRPRIPAVSVNDPSVTVAMLDLAKREGVHLTDVSIVSLKSGYFPNGAYGCPQEGRMYTQALVPGKQLILSVDGESFAYNGGLYGGYGYCATPDMLHGENVAR